MPSDEIALTDVEKRRITGSIQRTLTDGETGMSRADCNRAGWHVGAAVVRVVEQLLAERLTEQAERVRAAVEAVLAEMEDLADDQGEQMTTGYTEAMDEAVVMVRTALAAPTGSPVPTDAGDRNE